MLINQLLEGKSIIKSKHLNEDIYNLCDKTFVIPDAFEYDVVEVTRDYVARMDLISLKMYGTNQLSDLLCKVNGISNPFEVNEGDFIIVPSWDFISNFYYQEDVEESDSSNTNNKPKPKTRKEKRRANEAVIGDKRYRVDSARKVIIY